VLRKGNAESYFRGSLSNGLDIFRVIMASVKGVLYYNIQLTYTYDHRLERIGHPVRSAIHKLEIGGLVVGWVTTSEYPLLYVFDYFFVHIFF
jgi:hypothetical protein